MIVERESKAKGKGGKPATRYMVRVYVPDPSTGKRAWDTVGTFTRKGDAERAERKATLEVENGAYVTRAERKRLSESSVAPRVWTVAAVVTGWLTGRKVHVTSNTYAGYEGAWRLHVRPSIGDMDVTALTRADVKDLVRTWQAGGMGAQLQNRSLLVLRSALDEAVEDGILAANPAAGIRLPSPKSRRDLPVWTPDHLGQFLDAGERDQLGVFWHLTALEGFRRAEALGLRWGDLHWNADETACTATVVQTVVPDLANGGAPLIQPRAKTAGSQRSVTLTGATVAALRRHRDRQAFRRRDLADIWPDHDLIVTNELGGVVRPDSVARHRRAVMEAAKVPAISTHDLRHLAATTMLRGGASLAIVAQKIGHTDTSTTFGTYGHLTAEDQGAATRAVEAFLARATRTGTDGAPQ